MSTDTDRELLELAAKAAGHRVIGSHSAKGLALDEDSDGYWNPLTDDGDALRLAVKLEFDFRIFIGGATVVCHEIDEEIKEHGSDPYAATRGAIVRAAAEIGRTK